MISGRGAYTLLLFLMLPYVLGRLVWRAVRQPGYLQHLPERFGFFRHAPPDMPIFWIHAVSVGETRAAQPLIRAILARHAGCRVLLTHMTPTGRDAGMELFGDTVTRCYLPYDYPGAVRRFLTHFRPRAGMLMETEIWPNLVHACRERKVPLHLVNARLSEKSAAGYRRFGAFASASLGELTGILAQTDADAARFTKLGAHCVAVTGNLKFDVDPPAEQLALGERWRAAWGARPVLLAASTREGEEALLLDQLPVLAPETLLVIVPRHPQRFDDVAALINRRALPFQRRSANQIVESGTRVLLGDSMGEMFAYYRACDVAFIGGSLLPFGGQNLIEACAAGKPVLLGPSTYNFSEAAQTAIAAGASRRVADAGELMRVAQSLLNDASVAEKMGRAAADFSRAHRGATERTLEMLRLPA